MEKQEFIKKRKIRTKKDVSLIDKNKNIKLNTEKLF